MNRAKNWYKLDSSLYQFVCNLPLFQKTNETNDATEEDIDEFPDMFDLGEEETIIKPKVGEYWKVKNGATFLYATITNETPLEAQYFSPTKSKSDLYCLNEEIFAVFIEDMEEKIEPPEKIQKGRRKYYLF